MSDHPKPSVSIDGERIQLRARSKDQAAEVFALVEKNRVHLRPWLTWEGTTRQLEDSLTYLKQCTEWWAQGTSYEFSIHLKSSGKMIGSFGIHSLDWFNRSCELGYWIDKDHQGQGYISEAVQLAEQLALDLGLHRIVILCNRLNQKSQAVPRRLGYKLEALQIDERMEKDKLRDTLVFVKLVNPKIKGQYTDNLPEGFSIKDCDAKEFWSLLADHPQRIFKDNGLIMTTADVISDEEKGKLKILNETFRHPYVQHSVLLCAGSLAGWTWGYQDSRESYYMVNSAILTEYRGRGLYSRLLEATLEKLVDKGYQRIWSRHTTTNNAVIIPKLKRGFLITGHELSDVFGSLVHLTYFTNRTRRKVLTFRAGDQLVDDEIKKIFDI